MPCFVDDMKKSAMSSSTGQSLNYNFAADFDSGGFKTEGLKVKGKVFPYSLPSVGPGADPGVQAVSPQVT